MPRAKGVQCWILQNPQRIDNNTLQIIPQNRKLSNSFRFFLQSQHHPVTEVRQRSNRKIQGWRDGSMIKKHLLLFQKTQIWFQRSHGGSQPHVTLVSGKSEAFFWLPQVPGTYSMCKQNIHTCKQIKYI